MRKLLLTLLTVAASSPAAATVLNFDDLTGISYFTSNYGGFRLGTNNIADTAWFHSDEQTSFYAARSGSEYVATDFQLYTSNPFTTTQPISNTTPFVFNGAYFSGSDSVHYLLYLGNSLVYTSAPSADLTETPTFVASGYNGLVNSVVIYGHQGFYALDDFTYNVPPVTPSVPEPATWAMMMVGMGAVGFAMRRKSLNTRVRFA